MLTSEVLNRAADLIEERGWGQGPNTWQGDTLCLEGGLAAAMEWPVSSSTCPERYREFETCPAYRAVASYLDLGEASGVFYPWDWNDEGGRTQAQVIEVLRAAAAIEQAREAQPAVVTA